MWSQDIYKLLLILLTLQLSLSLDAQQNFNKTRGGKIFNLFQIVTFPNDPCNSNSGDTGTCLSSSECAGRGGEISGTCAQGFGACCLIYQKTCGGTVSYNCTYLQNPDYPSSYSTAGTCTWKLPKTSSDVCMIRLDFDEFSLAAPSTTGACTTDYFQSTGAATGNYQSTAGLTGLLGPRICGENKGSHIYVDAGQSLSADASLSAVISQGATWKIKVQQVLCSSRALPPTGCLQYHTGISGQVRSFNFLVSDSTKYKHLANQYYKACIRREAGYCKIAWSASSDPDSFKISRPDGNYNSNTGTAGCIPDFVMIPGSSNFGNEDGTCLTPGNTAQVTIDRYCGGTLTCRSADNTNPATIISSKLPFELGVYFNSQDGSNPAGNAVDAGQPTKNRGFCLNYNQLPC